MVNILEYEEFVLNEGVSQATFGEVRRELEPFGWECTHKSDGDGITFRKGTYKVGGNLKHNASKDIHRFVDINTLDRIRLFLLDEFGKTGDPSNLNAIDWVRWNLKDPFTKELKGYDKFSGKKKSEIEQLSKITFVEPLFKNVGVIQNDEGEYNLCRNKNDLRPLLDRWYPLYQASKRLGGKMCLGYEDDCDGDFDNPRFGTYLFAIKEDGTLGEEGETGYFIKESLDYEGLGNINTKEEKTDFGTVWYYDAEDGSFRFAVYQYDDDPDSLYFSNLFVKEENRGNGIGNVILKHIDDIANEKNATRIILRVKKESFVQKWYERNGYTYIEDDQEEPGFVWMEKQIS